MWPYNIWEVSSLLPDSFNPRITHISLFQLDTVPCHDDINVSFFDVVGMLKRLHTQGTTEREHTVEVHMGPVELHRYFQLSVYQFIKAHPRQESVECSNLLPPPMMHLMADIDQPTHVSWDTGSLDTQVPSGR